MKVLVTGGAGFIGSEFVRQHSSGLMPEFEQLIVLDKLTYAGNKSNLPIGNLNSFKFLKGDICDVHTISEILEEVDGVINFAAESHVDRSIFDSRAFVESNIFGVSNLLNQILKIKPEIRFLQISTDEVYGSIDKGDWTENSKLEPNSPYAASKASAELLIRSYIKTFNLDIVTTRASNTYGPFQNPEKLIPKAITNLLRGKKVPIYGTGENVRDWIHVSDHVHAVYKLFLNGLRGEIYNIGGNSQLTNIQLVKMILQILDLDNSKILFVEDRKGHDFRYSVNSDKLNNLGIVPKIDFRTGLINTISWYQENDEWWQDYLV